MKNDPIPDQDHIVRSVPFARLRKADGSEADVIGVLPDAFILRPNEDYLSASWLEFFSGSHEERKIKLVAILRQSAFKPTAKSRFAVGLVKQIKGVCKEAGHQIRIVHDPKEDNNSHVAVRRFPADAWELSMVLATEAWREWFLNSEIP